MEGTSDIVLQKNLSNQVVDLQDLKVELLAVNEKFDIFYNGRKLFLRFLHIRGTFDFNGKFGIMYLFLMKKEELYDKLWDAFGLPLIGRCSKELIVSDNIFPNGGLLNINELVIGVDSFVKSGKYYYPQISLASCNYQNRFDWEY